ncbi:MAG: phytoene desaturase [Bacteroidetes bacterium]|nr:phytoene desaturase [Bacteroidota bacterium]
MKSQRVSNTKIAVIGSGIAGLTSSAMLASKGFNVHVFEKNEQIGGRARKFEAEGFVFDMGPSWYWMPDVFEQYYNIMGYQTSDFYDLIKLDPGFKVIYSADESYDIPASMDKLYELFESIEQGSSKKLQAFLLQAEYKYQVGMSRFIFKPGHSITEFMSLKLLKDALRLQVFSSFSKHARSYFKDPRLLAIIEFPVLFLGAKPQDTPALYSLMNHAGLQQGTFYPMGGFGKVVQAFEKIALDAGVTIQTSQPITSFTMSSNKIKTIHSENESFEADMVVAGADYEHVERELLPSQFRSYNDDYWEKKVFAPSSLIFYLGVNKKIKKLSHHNLFFDEDFAAHAKEIYTTKTWPKKPLFYVCCPSKTDPSVAPEHAENLFILIPVAAGLQDSDENSAYYFEMIMKRLEKFAGENIREHLLYKRIYSVKDFTMDYNAYKGNAYGLANTLLQTAMFKPKMKSKKVSNLFYCGQLTVPGPGVPPAIIPDKLLPMKYLNF